MAKHKRQHFVPVSYLKRFSVGTNESAIGLYHLDSDKWVPCASLRDQAHRDYFYGGDLVVERALSKLERGWDRVVSQVIRSRDTPLVGSPAHLLLVTLAVFLARRTDYAAQQLNEMLDKSVKSIFARDSLVGGHLDDFQVQLEEPGRIAVGFGARFLPLALDLRLALVGRRGGVPFVTSDNPAVFYNRLMEVKQAPGSGTGIQCKGLQIFLPVSPDYCLMYFDSWAYTVCRSSEGYAEAKKQDVSALNALEYANANQCVYFSDDITPEMARRISEMGSQFRRAEKVRVKEYFTPDDPTGERHSLLVMSRADIRSNLELSFVKLTRDAQRYELGDTAFHVRDRELLIAFGMYESVVIGDEAQSLPFPAWLYEVTRDDCKRDLFENFLSLARAGLYTEGQFREWLDEVEKTEGTRWS